MESYGAILKKTREAKKLTIASVERDTSITRQYLEALESEDASVFPGEPYLVGFLKNYADYLGADSESLITLYHAKCIQEAPVPQALLAKHKSKWLVPLISVAVLLAVGGLGVWLYYGVLKIPERRMISAQMIAENDRVHQYEFTGTTQNVRLYKGDQILLPVESGQGNIVLTVAGTKGMLAVQTPSGTQMIDLSEERGLDVNDDGVPEIILYVGDISQTDETRGAEVRMLLKDPEAIQALEQEIAKVGEQDIAIPVVSSAVANKRPVIVEDNRAYPFTVTLSFRGPCLFRYRSDNKDVVEDYYRSGETMSISSQNRYRLWASNINTLKIQVQAGSTIKELELGKAGEVVVEDIKWIRDSDGRYRLVVDELD